MNDKQYKSILVPGYIVYKIPEKFFLKAPNQFFVYDSPISLEISRKLIENGYMKIDWETYIELARQKISLYINLDSLTRAMKKHGMYEHLKTLKIADSLYDLD